MFVSLLRVLLLLNMKYKTISYKFIIIVNQ